MQSLKIEPTDKELSSSYSATIRGRQDIDIYPQVSGTILKLCVTEGQKVRQGTVAFSSLTEVLLTEPAQSRHHQCGSGPRRYKHRRTDLQRQQGLYAQKVVSRVA